MAERKRRVVRIALIILAVLVLLPAAGVVVLALSFDANRLKPRLVAAIEQATGRDVAVEGPVSLALSLRPTLEVDNVKLGNAPGFTPTTMATLDRLDLRLALLPLLHHRIEIEQLALVHPVIALQINAEGHDNWHFQPSAAPAPAPVGPTAGPPTAAPTVQRTSLRIETISISGGAISFEDARTGAAIGVTGVQLAARQDDPDGPIHLDGTGSSQATPIAVSGDMGRPSDQFMPIVLGVNIADASVTIQGTAPRFAVAGRVPDLAALSPIAGRPLPALDLRSFQADVTPSSGGTFANGVALTGLLVTAPTGDLTGGVTIGISRPVAVRATLAGTNLDPAALIAAFAAPTPSPAAAAAAAVVPAPAAPASAPADARAQGSAPAPAPPAIPQATWLVTDRPWPYGELSQLDADATLSLRDTRIGAATIKSIATHLTLHAGHLAFEPLTIASPGGRIDATLMADASGAASLTLRAPALSIQPLLAAFDQPDGVVGNLELRADLHGVGATPHALAASLDGSIGLALANGEIDNRLLIALLSRIAPEAGLLDLAGKPGRSALRCVALRADVAHGVADLHALLLETVPLRLTGSGTVDLGQETLALRLQPLARIGATGLSVPVDIRGSLRAPRAAVDTAAGGGGLSGIVMGALGADRLIAGAGQSDGCAEQLKLARFGDPGPVPAALPAQAAGKQAPPNLNNLLKQLLR